MVYVMSTVVEDGRLLVSSGGMRKTTPLDVELLSVKFVPVKVDAAELAP